VSGGGPRSGATKGEKGRDRAGKPWAKGGKTLEAITRTPERIAAESQRWERKGAPGKGETVQHPLKGPRWRECNKFLKKIHQDNPELHAHASKVSNGKEKED